MRAKHAKDEAFLRLIVEELDIWKMKVSIVIPSIENWKEPLIEHTLSRSPHLLCGCPTTLEAQTSHESSEVLVLFDSHTVTAKPYRLSQQYDYTFTQLYCNKIFNESD